MSMQVTILLVIQVISSFTIIALVLLQQGKGADMGSAFGSGSSGSLFGATGAANFMSRATKWAAVVFFVATIGLAYMSTTGLKSQSTGIMETFKPESSVPSVPGGSIMPTAPATSPSVPAAPSSSSGASSVPAAPAGASAPASVPAVPVVPAVPK